MQFLLTWQSLILVFYYLLCKKKEEARTAIQEGLVGKEFDYDLYLERGFGKSIRDF